MSNISQCSCCGRIFLVVSDEVLYCSLECKGLHSLFQEEENTQDIKKRQAISPAKIR